MIGVVITTVGGLLLQRVASAIRQEQMIGTLESLLISPTSPTTVQAGSVAFDLLFIPVRMGRCWSSSRSPSASTSSRRGAPALALFAAFVPFVWGLGLVTARGILTFRRGTGVLGAAMSVLGLASGAFFPLALLPGWLQTLAEANPVAIAMEGMREALIGGAGWAAVGGRGAGRVPLAMRALVGGLSPSGRAGPRAPPGNPGPVLTSRVSGLTGPLRAKPRRCTSVPPHLPAGCHPSFPLGVSFSRRR